MMVTTKAGAVLPLPAVLGHLAAHPAGLPAVALVARVLAAQVLAVQRLATALVGHLPALPTRTKTTTKAGAGIPNPAVLDHPVALPAVASAVLVPAVLVPAVQHPAAALAGHPHGLRMMTKRTMTTKVGVGPPLPAVLGHLAARPVGLPAVALVARVLAVALVGAAASTVHHLVAQAQVAAVLLVPAASADQVPVAQVPADQVAAVAVPSTALPPVVVAAQREAALATFLVATVPAHHRLHAPAVAALLKAMQPLKVMQPLKAMPNPQVVGASVALVAA